MSFSQKPLFPYRGSKHAAAGWDAPASEARQTQPSQKHEQKHQHEHASEQPLQHEYQREQPQGQQLQHGRETPAQAVATVTEPTEPTEPTELATGLTGAQKAVAGERYHPARPQPAPVIIAENLRVHYASRSEPALSIGHFGVGAGERLALTGANGAGKSTLLKTLAGLIRPDAGSVRLFGLPPEQVHGRVAYLPQLRAIDWHYPISVFDFALLGAAVRLGWFARPGKASKRRAMQELERLDLARLATRQIRELSGGEQQRLLLARALLPQPELFLLDEPLTAVDARSVEVIGDILQQQHLSGRTLVVATHHLDFGPAFGFDRQVRLHCGCLHVPGQTVQTLNEAPAPVRVHLSLNPKKTKAPDSDNGANAKAAR